MSSTLAEDTALSFGPVLAQKTALVTGASRGIGRAIALLLGRLGASVAICARSKEIEVTAEELRAQGIKTLPIVADVTVAADVRRMVEKTCTKLGEIEILINNAGLGIFGPVHERTESDWDAVLNTNLKGAFHFIQGLERFMLKQHYGRIVNISSVSGLIGQAGQANYSASKAGLIGLTKAQLPDAMRAHVLSLIPLAKFGECEDIAAAVAFIASPEAKYITGQVLTVDGGMAM